MNLDTLKDTPPWDWPQDTGKRLLEVLRNSTSSQAERKLAAELADDEILEALSSPSQDIRYQAVCAAGNWQIDAAWLRIKAILTADKVDKDLLIAAIEAAVAIRPQASADLDGQLTYSEDEDIAGAAFEALAMAEGLAELKDDECGDELWR